ncbi:MAG: esterase, partial [Acidimicrobiales bacterium]
MNAESDPRVDPRIRAMLSRWPQDVAVDVASREELLAEASSPEGRRSAALEADFMNEADNEDVAPSQGLSITSREIVAQPVGNHINLRIIRPENHDVLPCVYYIHGGGMVTLSCYFGAYSA